METSDEDNSKEDIDIAALTLCADSNDDLDDRELWYKCTVCEYWAHEACTDAPNSRSYCMCAINVKRLCLKLIAVLDVTWQFKMTTKV